MIDFCRTLLKPAILIDYFLYVVIFVTFKAAYHLVTIIIETDLIFYFSELKLCF